MNEDERQKAIACCDKILESIALQQQALANIAKIFDNVAHGRPATEGLPKREGGDRE